MTPRGWIGVTALAALTVVPLLSLRPAVQALPVPGHETRLSGTVQQTGPGTLTLLVTDVVSPEGQHEKSISPHPKTVELPTGVIFHREGETSPATLADLTSGLGVTVYGKNLGLDKALVARLIELPAEDPFLDPAQTLPDGTLQVTARPRLTPWKGWDGANLPHAPEDPAHPTPKVVYTLAPTPAGAVPTFSGRVTGLDTYAGAQIGVVSLDGIYWIDESCYSWSAVAADGTFTVTAASAHAAAPKALVVKAPDRPWTFLRHNFDGSDSATGIVLPAQPAQMVKITAGTATLRELPNFGVEVFDAYSNYDDAGKNVLFQRYGWYGCFHPGGLSLALPQKPVSLFIHADGVAGDYVTIDPRRANHFHFLMLPEAKIKVTVTQKGQPAAKESVMVVNDSAPLSAGRSQTNLNGQATFGGLSPGTWQVYIGNTQKQVTVKVGEVKQLTVTE